VKAWRRARVVYLKIMRLSDPPEKIALGASIGVFMGILPTFGVGIVLALILAAVVRANKAAAVLGSLVMNPLTTPFFWSLSVLVGSVLMGEDYHKILEKVHNEGLFRGFGRAYMVYTVGNIIVSTVFAGATYLFIRWAVTRYRKLKAAKRDSGI
jgi:uncharacterized protein